MTTSTLSKDQILTEFLSSGEQFVAAVLDLPDAALDCALVPGEWSIRQIVHHVADDADLWCFALKKAIASPGAPVRFEGFPGNERWFAALGFNQRPVTAALALFRAHRKLMAEIVACTEPDWEQSTIDLFDDQAKPLGRLGVGQILQMLTDHTREHVTTLQAIRQQNGL